jgi:hypothetical protein
LIALSAACGTSSSPNPNSEGASGAGGGASTGGSSASGGGGSTSSGSGGSSTVTTGGSAGASEDDSGTPGTDDASAGGGSFDDSGAPNGDDGGTAVAGDGGMCSGTIYNAAHTCAGGNAPPCTVISGKSKAGANCPNCTMCPPDGEDCCPAPPGETGGVVHNILLGGSSVTFTGVYAPADGDYDIVWYSHCGNADTDYYKSATCPSSPEGSTSGPPGCREAAFTVNGVDDPKLYEMPCYLRISDADHGWNHIHSWVRTENFMSQVRVPFHLKAGTSNTIKIYARDHDVVDLAAIRVPDGK